MTIICGYVLHNDDVRKHKKSHPATRDVQNVLEYLGNILDRPESVESVKPT